MMFLWLNFAGKERSDSYYLNLALYDILANKVALWATFIAYCLLGLLLLTLFAPRGGVLKSTEQILKAQLLKKSRI